MCSEFGFEAAEIRRAAEADQDDADARVDEARRGLTTHFPLLLFAHSPSYLVSCEAMINSGRIGGTEPNSETKFLLGFGDKIPPKRRFVCGLANALLLAAYRGPAVWYSGTTAILNLWKG